MEELIIIMEEHQNLESVIKSWCVQNSIEQPKIMSYSLERVSKLYDNYLEKYGSQKNILSQKENLFEPVWFENELILFQWTVIAYSLCHRIYVKKFNKSQIEFLSSIFRRKQFYIIDYQIKCMLIKGKQIRNAWKIDQEKTLSAIIKQMPEKNKWNQIARQLYKVSGGIYFRQGKHCRERWFSYMQNRNVKKDWNVESDIELLQLVSAIGKNWSQIANNFTISQTRSFLKKRFKILTEGVKAKFEQNISEKQVLQLLLREKYLQHSQEKEQYLLKNKKPNFLKSKSQTILLSIEENINNSNSSSKQNKLNLQMDKQNFHNQQQGLIIQSKVQEEDQQFGKLAHSYDQQNWMVFSGPTQIFTGAYCDQLIPMQYYPNNLLISQTNLAESLNWWPCSTPYQSEGSYLFY